jgi:hypothetical protein
MNAKKNTRPIGVSEMDLSGKLPANLKSSLPSVEDIGKGLAKFP